MKQHHLTILYVLFVLVGSTAFLSIACIRVGLIAPLDGFHFIKLTVVASGILGLLFIISCLIYRKECSSNTLRFYAICILISFVYTASWLTFHYNKTQLPKINDVVTNTNQPLTYIRVANLRHTDDHDVSYPEEFINLQEYYYPEIRSLILSQDTSIVFDEVVDMIQHEDWDIISLYPTEGVIEATVTTPVFWFTDDVIIRVKAHNDGSIIDMRSSSRIGRGDYGTNAERVICFLKKLKRNVDENL